MRTIAAWIRNSIGYDKKPCFPVIQFLEYAMPILFPGFNYEIVEDNELGNKEGLTILFENLIKIPERVYKDAVAGKGRARFTILHEIAYYFLLSEGNVTYCYAECPIYKQIENISKSRELSFWFSKQGINVIPNVRWGLKETYNWCFDGLPKKSTVAVSTLGCSSEKASRRMFMDGFFEMLQRLNPKTIVIYGTKSEKLFPALFVYNTKLIFFESQYTISHYKEGL